MKHLSYAGYARQIITTHLDRLCLETEKASLEAGDIEAVHQARVASRRLRNAFWVFHDIMPDKKLKMWKEMLRGHAAVLGAARDLDIQIAFLCEFRKSLRKKTYRDDVDKLLKILRKKRVVLGEDVMHIAGGMIKSGVLSRIREDVDDMAARDRRKGRHKLYLVAKDKVWKRLTDLLIFESYVSQPEKSAELHRMRIAAKKLRYTLENFEPLYGKRMERFIASVHHVQDLLGDLHDLDVWIRAFPELIKESHGGRCPRSSAEHFTGRCNEMRAKVYGDFEVFWKKEKSGGEWDELAGFVSSFDYGS